MNYYFIALEAVRRIILAATSLRNPLGVNKKKKIPILVLYEINMHMALVLVTS